jgi:hypothetical protein
LSPENLPVGMVMAGKIRRGRIWVCRVPESIFRGRRGTGWELVKRNRERLRMDLISIYKQGYVYISIEIERERVRVYIEREREREREREGAWFWAISLLDT